MDTQQSIRSSILMDLFLCSRNHNFRISYHHVWTSCLIATHNQPVFEDTVQIPGLFILTSLTLLHKWEFNYTDMNKQFLNFNCEFFYRKKIPKITYCLAIPSDFRHLLQRHLLIPVSGIFFRLKGYNYLSLLVWKQLIFFNYHIILLCIFFGFTIPFLRWCNQKCSM